MSEKAENINIQQNNFEDWYNEPRVVSIVSIKNDSPEPLQFHAEALQKILSHDNVRQVPVVVVCIAGAFRSGKSFVLNFLLRYLSTKSWLQATLMNDDPHAWLGADKTVPLSDGFPWRAGIERHTDGVLACSRPIRVQRDGCECAILIVDTQGTFDLQSSTHQVTAIFAFSALLSSVLVCNVRGGQIGGDLLEQLQFFVEYGRSATRGSASRDGNESGYGFEVNGQPFQTLVMLVRDWQNPSEREYGQNGGHTYLAQLFEIDDEEGDDTNSEETREITNNLRECFQELRCWLLPRPGECITSSNYNGSIDKLSPEFVEQTALFIEMLAAVATQTPKRIDGKQITCEELFTYASQYADLLNRAPTVHSWRKSTSDASDRLAVNAAVEQFETYILQNAPGVTENKLTYTEVENEAKRLALATYETKRSRVEGEISGGESQIATVQAALQARSERLQQLMQESKEKRLAEQVEAMSKALGEERAAREEERRLLTTGNRNGLIYALDTVLEIAKNFAILVVEGASFARRFI